MTRSFKKPTYIASQTQTLQNGQKIWVRSSTILPQHLNVVCQIHNGKSFVSVKITEEMIGHKFGEFALTRKRPTHKKKVKVKAKK